MIDLDAIRKRDAAAGALDSVETGDPAVEATLDRRALLAKVDELLAWQRAMVEKAAAKSLDGYRELGQKAAKAENRAEYWKAEHQEANREIDRLTAERQALRDQVAQDTRDAARYQWLRNLANPDNGNGVCVASWESTAMGQYYFKHYHGARLDGIVDVAIALKPESTAEAPICACCNDAGCSQCHGCNSPGCELCAESKAGSVQE